MLNEKFGPIRFFFQPLPNSVEKKKQIGEKEKKRYPEMLPRIQTANPRARGEDAKIVVQQPAQRVVSSANPGGPAAAAAGSTKAASAAVKKKEAIRDAWNSAPTAHDVLLYEARQELANMTVMKKILVAPPSGPRPPAPQSQSAPCLVDSGSGSRTSRPGSSSVFARRYPSASAQRTASSPSAACGDVSLIPFEESEKRCALLSREVWEVEVIGQMAQVHYINNVIMPLLDRCVGFERETRCGIRADEAAEFSNKILKSTLFSRLRQMKAERDREIRRRQVIGCSSSLSGNDGSTPDEAERILREYRQQFSLRERSPSLPMPPQQEEESTALATDDDIPMPPPRAAHKMTAVPQPPQLLTHSPRHPTRTTTGAAVIVVAPALTLVQVRPLLDELTYTRRVQTEEEQHVRGDIQLSFELETNRVRCLADRRQHLERLIYWRQEREENQRLAELLVTFAEQRDAMSDLEAAARLLIAEGQASSFSTSCVYVCIADRHRVERLLLEEEERESRLCQIELSQRVEAALTLVVFHEQVERAWIQTHVYEPFYHTAIAKHDELIHLAKDCIRIRQFVLVIQRSFKLSRLGLLGWHRTHRSIGFYVQKRRAEKLVVKNRHALTSYRDEILAELREEAVQQLERQMKHLRAIEAEEKNKRQDVRMDEALELTGSVRRFRTNFIKTVFVPQLVAMDMHRQGPLRLELVEAESCEWEHLIESFAVTSIMIRARQEVQNNFEPTAHHALLNEEEDLFLVIAQQFRTEKAAVIEVETRRSERHRNERQHVEEACEEERAAEERNFEQELAYILWLKQCNRLELMAFDSKHNGRGRLVQVFYAVLIAQHERFALHVAGLVADELTGAHQALVLAASMAIIASQESEARSGLASDEESAHNSIVTSEFAAEYERIEAYLANRNRAASVIQRILRACLSGRLGRTATLSYLRTYFWSRREKAFLRRAQESTKRAVLSAKDELEREIASHNLATEQEYLVLFNEITERMEPRRRDALLSHETFLRLIHYHNMETLVKETIRTATEELREHESYQRVKLNEAYEHDYRTIFFPMKACFVVDVSVRPIQRAWRCHEARRVYRAKCSDAVHRIHAVEEVMQRKHLELLWLDILAMEIVKPILQGCIQPMLYSQRCLSLFQSYGVAMCRQAIMDEEWRLRVNALWILQQHERYDLIESAEITARRVIFDDARERQQAIRDVLDFEGVLRHTQQQERTLFLLRVLASMELEDRATTMEEQLQQFAAIRNEFTFWQSLVAESLRSQATVENDENADRVGISRAAALAGDQLQLELDESCMRRAVSKDASTSSFLARLVVEQELCIRRNITAAQKLESLSQYLTFSEALERSRLAHDWRSKMVVQAGPVLRAVQPYHYTLGCMEEEQRDSLIRDDAAFWLAARGEKDKLYATTVRAGAIHMVAAS